MKFAEGGYIFSSGIRLDTKPHLAQCIYACMTQEQAKILGFNIGVGMSEIASRPLVVKRLGSQLALHDEQTGELLQGQTSVVLVNRSGEPPKVTVTFDAWGAHGVRFEDDPRQEQ